MPGPGGMAPCPPPEINETCPATPTYEQLGSSLWPCPGYNKSTGGDYYNKGSCTPGVFGSNKRNVSILVFHQKIIRVNP